MIHKFASYYLSKGFIYLLYFIIIFSSVLDYRLIIFDPNLNYARIGIVVFFVLTLLSLFITKVKIKYDKIFYILCFYSFYKLLSITFSIDKLDTFLNFSFWLSISFLYLAIYNLKYQKYLESIKTVIVIAGVINALVGLSQAFLFYFYKIKFLNIYGWLWPNGFRVTGLSFDANHLAAFILLPIFISIQRLINVKNKHKIYYLLSTLILLIAFYFSASRSATIALFVGVFFYVLYTFVNFKNYKRFAVAFVFSVPLLFVLAGAMFSPLTDLKQQNKLAPVNSVIFNATKYISKHGRGLDPSAFAHFALIYSSFYMQSENYFLGVGAGNFAEGLKQNPYLSANFESVDATVFAKEDFPSHSMYGEALAEGGILGLIILFAILFLILLKYLNVLEKNRQVLPFFLYFYSMCFFMLFYNINEEFFWLFVFLGVSSIIQYKNLDKA